MLPAPPALLTHTIPDAQLDGIEFGNPVMMQHQKWAEDMAMDRSRLPSDAHGVGIYSSHWNDNNGFTWQGNAALIAQDDAPCGRRWRNGEWGDVGRQGMRCAGLAYMGGIADKGP